MAVNGLNKITEKILAEARAEAERITAQAEAECARIQADYSARADAIREALSVEAEREGNEIVSRAKAASENQRRNKLLETRSKLIDAAFADALTGLKTLEPEKYTELLVGLLSSALLEQAEAEEISRTLYGEEEAMAPLQYEVLLNARDRERSGKALIEGTRKHLAGKLSDQALKKVVLAEQTVNIDGGLILRCGDIESNCSFAILFAQLREELEAEVSRALFDNVDKRL